MKLLTLKHEFLITVDSINADDGETFPLQPDMPSGWYAPKRINELLEFCRVHQDYHIASEIDDDIILNRFIPKSVCYYLCQGSRDINLLYVFVAAFIDESDDDILKFIRQEFPSVLSDLD